MLLQTAFSSGVRVRVSACPRSGVPSEAAGRPLNIDVNNIPAGRRMAQYDSGLNQLER